MNLKSIITLILIATLCLITLGTLVYAFVSGSPELFTATFGLFGAQVGSVVTYYFTRKSTDTEIK